MDRFKGSITKDEIHRIIKMIDKDDDKRINKKGTKCDSFVLGHIHLFNGTRFVN
jgi:hypothetical protein